MALQLSQSKSKKKKISIEKAARDGRYRRNLPKKQESEYPRVKRIIDAVNNR